MCIVEQQSSIRGLMRTPICMCVHQHQYVKLGNITCGKRTSNKTPWEITVFWGKGIAPMGTWSCTRETVPAPGVTLSNGNVYDNGKEQGWEQYEEEPKRRLALEETWGKSTSNAGRGFPHTPVGQRGLLVPHTGGRAAGHQKRRRKTRTFVFSAILALQDFIHTFLRLEAIRYAPNPKK